MRQSRATAQCTYGTVCICQYLFLAESRVVGMPRASLSLGKTIVSQRQVQFRPQMHHHNTTAASIQTRDDAIERVWPRVFSVDHTKLTTRIQIRLPDGSRDPYRDPCFVCLTNVSTVVFRLLPLRMVAPSGFCHCVSGPFPDPRTSRAPMTSLSSNFYLMYLTYLSTLLF
jgi:hypothetical protein